MSESDTLLEEGGNRQGRFSRGRYNRRHVNKTNCLCHGPFWGVFLLILFIIIALALGLGLGLGLRSGTSPGPIIVPNTTTVAPTTTTVAPTTTTVAPTTTTVAPTTTTTVAPTTTPVPSCSLDPIGGVPPPPLACYTDTAYVSVTCGPPDFGPDSKCRETSLAQMNMLTGEITVVGRMLGNYSVLNLFMGPDNLLYGVGTRIGGCNPITQPTMFFRVDKATGVATQLCNTTAFLLNSPSITLGINSNGTVFFKISGITFLFSVNLATCTLTQLGPNGHVTFMGTVYKDIVYENGAFFYDGLNLYPLSRTVPPYTGAPVYVGCNWTLNSAGFDTAYGLYPYVNSTNITSFRLFLVPSATPTIEQFMTVGLDPSNLCNLTLDLTIPVNNLNYTVWDVTSPCYYNIQQEGTIPPIAKRDTLPDGYTVYLSVEDVVFVFDPVAVSVMPYLGGEFGGVVGVVFDELFTSSGGILYGLKKKQGGVGFTVYAVNVPSSTVMCDYTTPGGVSGESGDVRFVYGMDSNYDLWYVAINNIEYTISIPGCLVTARGVLLQENCTSGALLGNQAASGGTLNVRFCATNEGVVYDLSTNIVAGSVSVNSTAINFGLDLFVYCPTYGLYLFYETNSGGLLFDNAVEGPFGAQNISFPLGDPTKKWSAASTMWC